LTSIIWYLPAFFYLQQSVLIDHYQSQLKAAATASIAAESRSPRLNFYDVDSRRYCNPMRQARSKACRMAETLAVPWPMMSNAAARARVAMGMGTPPKTVKLKVFMTAFI